MTLPEMRKRTRSVLDYMGRVQTEMCDRSERAAKLGFGPADYGRPDAPLSGAMELMNSLTRDIIHFQDRFFGLGQQQSRTKTSSNAGSSAETQQA
jgi:hypothetical protein